MKKFIYTLFALLMCICLAGCSADKALETSTEAAIIETAPTSHETESTEKAVDKTTSKKAASTTEKATVKPSSTKAETTSHSTTAKKTTEHKTTQKATTKKPSTTRATTTTTTKSSEVRCTITVECSEILDNMDDLQPGHEAFVPSDGVIIKATTVTVKSGSTAYDVLKAVCESKGISLNVSSGGYGKYIVGINNIDEKDCGSQSGWTYTVNESSIWKSCDKYIVKNSDKIKFRYVCNW